MINAPTEPRCPRCTSVLVHAGAICVICDDRSHYEAPIRTAPPLVMPERSRAAESIDQAVGSNPWTRASS